MRVVSLFVTLHITAATFSYRVMGSFADTFCNEQTTVFIQETRYLARHLKVSEDERKCPQLSLLLPAAKVSQVNSLFFELWNYNYNFQPNNSVSDNGVFSTQQSCFCFYHTSSTCM